MECSIAIVTGLCQSTVRGDQGELGGSDIQLFLKIGLVLTKGKPESLSLHGADPEKRDPGIGEEQRSPVSAP